MTATLIPDIAELIPHQAPMMLVDSITAWDEHHIICQATSHVERDNPLRDDGRLSVFAGVEYAAQALAAHARLREPDLPPKRGMIATASKLTPCCQWLDEHTGALTIRVELLASNLTSSMCQFHITCGATDVLSGQLTALTAEP